MLEHLRRLLEQAVTMEAEARSMTSFLQVQTHLIHLQNLMVQVRRGMKESISDDQYGTSSRPARVWVAVGPGGIPDDVSIIFERWDWSMTPPIISTTEIDAAKDAGRSTVIPDAAFLALGARLVEDAPSGRLSLPYDVGLHIPNERV